MNDDELANEVWHEIDATIKIATCKRKIIICLGHRNNQWERQRICGCGRPYFYSRYLRHGMCAECMNKAKQARLAGEEV